MWTDFLLARIKEGNPGRWTTVYVSADSLPEDALPARCGGTKFEYPHRDESARAALREKHGTDGPLHLSLSLRKPTREGWLTLALRFSSTTYHYAWVPIEGHYYAICDKMDVAD
jgi:hypothetical protein